MDVINDPGWFLWLRLGRAEVGTCSFDVVQERVWVDGLRLE